MQPIANQKRSLLDYLIMFIILLRCAIVIMPVSQLFTNQLVNMGSLFLLFLVVFVGRGKLSIERLKDSLMVCALLILQIFGAILRGGSWVESSYVLLQYLIWPLLGFYVAQNCSSKEKKIIIYVCFVFILATMITTYLGCKIYPGISRNLATPDAQQNGLNQIAYINNIGGFSFVYISVLITPFLILLMKKGTLIQILLGIILLVFMMVYVIETNYTTALFVFLSSLFIFFMPSTFHPSFFFKLILGVLLLFIISKFFIVDMLYSSAEALGDNDISVRLTEVGDILSGKDLTETDDTASRFDKWSKSLSSFLRHPLFGSEIIGGHSFIFDNMALYGLFGIISLYYVFKGEKKCIMQTISNKSSIFYGICLFVFGVNIILCVVNTVNFIFLITFLYPIIFNYFESCESLQNVDLQIS